MCLLMTESTSVPYPRCAYMPDFSAVTMYVEHRSDVHLIPPLDGLVKSARQWVATATNDVVVMEVSCTSDRFQLGRSTAYPSYSGIACEDSSTPRVTTLVTHTPMQHLHTHILGAQPLRKRAMTRAVMEKVMQLSVCRTLKSIQIMIRFNSVVESCIEKRSTFAFVVIFIMQTTAVACVCHGAKPTSGGLFDWGCRAVSNPSLQPSRSSYQQGRRAGPMCPS